MQPRRRFTLRHGARLMLNSSAQRSVFIWVARNMFAKIFVREAGYFILAIYSITETGTHRTVVGGGSLRNLISLEITAESCRAFAEITVHFFVAVAARLRAAFLLLLRKFSTLSFTQLITTAGETGRRSAAHYRFAAAATAAAAATTAATT